MYYETLTDGECPKCKKALNSCICKNMCFHCKFYKNRTCDNKNSGNFKIMLAYDEACSKFDKKIWTFSYKSNKFF